ncbi:MAG: sulfatase-like hydrolase/transferase, partial [Gemmatimonadetes bacterium]|nr:sulfatase-like hydrolase/transferase [Gemmatimonadota bacterium]
MLVLLLLAGCGPRPTPDGARAVMLLTLDTFRADNLGSAGNPRTRTPHLDRLARRGIQWSGAVSPVPLTTPSHATILSGDVPGSHGVLKNRMVLKEDVPTMTEVFRAEGYRTGAFVSRSAVLAARFGLNQGFDHYEVIEPKDRPSHSDGPGTTRAARRWLKKHGGAGSFLWAHYFDAHIPYLPPVPLNRLYDPDYDGEFYLADWPIQDHFRRNEVQQRDVDYMAALYASEVTFLDGCVGDLLRSEAARDAIICVTADHGEGLWE